MKTTSTNPLDSSARLFKAFADPVRLRLMNLLADREVCVCHLHGALELPQPTVSRHLAYLKKTGLVVGRKDGLWVHYRLAKPGGPGLHRTLLGSIGTCFGDVETFTRDKERVGRLTCC